MPNIFFLYMTAPTIDEARSISKLLLEEKLIACANILPQMESLYRWEGEVKNEPEFAVILKTAEPRVQAVIDRIKKIHSYDCPCVVALPAAGGNPEFLDWVSTQI